MSPSRSRRFRRTLAALPLLIVAVAAVPAPAKAQTEEPPAEPPCPRFAELEIDNFGPEPEVDNTWLPFTPGTRLTLEGRANRGGGPLPHQVTFTVTDLVKEIDGIATRVIWDVDVNEGELAEAELAFFAQDIDGNVWNVGEYPEEYEGDTFLGAPNTWIHGVGDAEGGVHMPKRPVLGMSWLQGFVPEIEFLDCATVMERNQRICVPFRCYEQVLVTHEISPLDPAGGIQVKYHAPRVGIVQVGAIDDPEGETLVLIDRKLLNPEELEEARNEALTLDRRGYFVSDVYCETPPMELPPGVEDPIGLSAEDLMAACTRPQPPEVPAALPAPTTPPPLAPSSPPAPVAPTIRGPPECVVPRLRGLRVRRARKALRRAGCRYRIRGRGRVVGTWPRAGVRTSLTVRVIARPPTGRRDGHRRPSHGVASGHSGEHMTGGLRQ
jgi:hypothetical protein